MQRRSYYIFEVVEPAPLGVVILLLLLVARRVLRVLLLFMLPLVVPLMLPDVLIEPFCMVPVVVEPDVIAPAPVPLAAPEVAVPGVVWAKAALTQRAQAAVRRNLVVFIKSKI